MPEPQKMIIGREKEVSLFESFLAKQSLNFILNIFGPGGIGKTEIFHELLRSLKKQKVMHAAIQGDTQNLTFDRMLKLTALGLIENDFAFEGFVSNFDLYYTDYLRTKDIISRGGGIGNLFDITGSVAPDLLTKLLSGLGKELADEIKLRFTNQYSLEQYLLGAETLLSQKFVEALSDYLSATDTKIVIMIDTYEKLKHLDEWFCNTLIRLLPRNVYIVIVGRDRLTKTGFHWVEFSNRIVEYEVPELVKEKAMAFYRYHGLRDDDLLEKTYDFTGGYPLCMILAVDLAKRTNWNKLAGFEKPANRYEVARLLLDRLLQQEEVQDVREFLEKGVVTLWFDIQAVSYLLGISSDQAEQIYNKIGKFSFTQETDYGLKFHDKVRDILIERLKYMNPTEYRELLEKWSLYFRTRVDESWQNL